MHWTRTAVDVMAASTGHRALRFEREGVSGHRYAAYGPPGSADPGWLQAPLHAQLRACGVPIPHDGGQFSAAPAFLGEYATGAEAMVACEAHAEGGNT